MSADLTREEVVGVGAEAEELVEGDAFALAMEGALAQIVTEWLGAEDPQARENAWAKAHGLKAVGDSLRRMVNDGEYARAAIAAGPRAA